MDSLPLHPDVFDVFDLFSPEGLDLRLTDRVESLDLVSLVGLTLLLETLHSVLHLV